MKQTVCLPNPYRKLENGEDDMRLVILVDPPEVWGCGVTYKRSQESRELEAGIKGIYNKVYYAARPETFFKGTAHRCVGPEEEICIRGDSHWNVPELELAFILRCKPRDHRLHRWERCLL